MPARGFTLLEMLISITLVGLLMVALVTGLHVANKAWQQGEARLDQVHAEEERERFMFQQIASLVPYQVSSTDPSVPGNFAILEAGPARLRFLTTSSSRAWNRSGRLLTEYALVPIPKEGFAVAVRETPVRDDAALLPMLIERVDQDPDTGNAVIVHRPFLLRASDLRLMTGLDDGGFEYLGSLAAGKPPVWASNWEPTTEALFPEAVRFTWQRRGEREQFVIPIRARFLPK